MTFEFEEEPLNKPKNEEENLKLKKELGLMDGVGIIIGVIVGSGIFISPTGVVQYSGSTGMALLVWGLTGLLCMVGALCYSELGTMIPKSGGDYAYINEAFGSLPAFLYMWVALIIIMPTSNTVISLTFANYIIQPLFPNCEKSPDDAVRLIAALVACFLTWINCSNVKISAKITVVFSVAKIIALVAIIGTGIYHLGTGHVENYQNPFEGTNWDASSISIAFYQGFFSFAGWSYLNFVVEELKDPYSRSVAELWDTCLGSFLYSSLVPLSAG